MEPYKKHWKRDSPVCIKAACAKTALHAFWIRQDATKLDDFQRHTPKIYHLWLPCHCIVPLLTWQRFESLRYLHSGYQVWRVIRQLSVMRRPWYSTPCPEHPNACQCSFSTFLGRLQDWGFVPGRTAGLGTSLDVRLLQQDRCPLHLLDVGDAGKVPPNQGCRHFW